MREQAPVLPEANEREAAMRDARFYFHNMPLVEETVTHAHEALAYITTLKNFVQKEADIELRRTGLLGNSLEGLCAIMRKSGEHQWQVDPHFYLALNREMVRRLELGRTLPDADLAQALGKNLVHLKGD